MPEHIAGNPDAARVGPGRRCVVMTPCPGVLWTNNDDAVGFQPIPAADVDPGPVNRQLDTGIAAGLTPSEVFDQIAALIGKDVVACDLTTWHPTHNRRPNLGPEPTMTSPSEVLAALE